MKRHWVKETLFKRTLVAATVCSLVFSAAVFGDSSEGMRQQNASDSLHQYLNTPGFRAVIGSAMDRSFIFLESERGGLVFRACSMPEVSDNGRAGNRPWISPSGQVDPEKCPTILNNAGFVIPSQLLLKKGIGIGTVLMAALHVVADAAVLATMNMGTTLTFSKGIPFSIAAVGAKSWATVHPDNPLAAIEETRDAERTNNKILSYGDEHRREHDPQVVTVLLTRSYTDILRGITDELRSIVKKALKHEDDGSLGIQWENTYHEQINSELTFGGISDEAKRNDASVASVKTVPDTDTWSDPAKTRTDETSRADPVY